MRPLQGRNHLGNVIRGRRFALPPAILFDAFSVSFSIELHSAKTLEQFHRLTRVPLPHLGVELRLKSFHEPPMDLVYFLITQSAILRAVLETQRNRTLAVGDALALVGADKMRANEIPGPFV